MSGVDQVAGRSIPAEKNHLGVEDERFQAPLVPFA